MKIIKKLGQLFIIVTVLLFLYGYSEITLAASTGHRTCLNCNGLGKLICTNCNGNGYIIKEKVVVDGTIYVSSNGLSYEYKSRIQYIPCVTCGGSSDTAEYYAVWNVYYRNNNFTGFLYEVYSPVYVAGSGYRGTCASCSGNGEVAITYYIKYNGNGNTSGSMSNSMHTYGINQTLHTNQFKRVGYTFLGWSIVDGVVTDTGTDVAISYKENASVKNLTTEHDKVINLYAIWQRNEYSVTYEANGGVLEASNKTKSFYYGDSVDLSLSCVKEGYVFLGWAMKSTDTMCVSSYQMEAKNITLYALYSIPISDVKEAHIISYNTDNPRNYNLFELQKESETVNGYVYETTGINLLQGLRRENLNIWLLLYDYAGNRNEIPIKVPESSEEQNPEDIPVPNIYLQTVEHYIWDMNTESYQYYMSISELVYEGEIYVPKYIQENSHDYPIGYKTEAIEDSYIVNGIKTTKAYYKPISYTLYFETNGGNCDTISKVVYTGSMYGELPTPSREGYYFRGWYTQKTGGIQKKETDIYETIGDSTLYAIWEKHMHTVVYDYSTNGGISVDRNYNTVAYGEPVDLTVRATKHKWEFVGWNTNPNATEPIDSLEMEDEDIVLYAIYKKDIKATFIDWKNESVFQRESNVSIYNNETKCKMIVLQQNERDGWKTLGWTTSEEADGIVEVSSGSQIWLTEDVTLYGCYMEEIILSYDTNGSSEEIDSQIGERYFNASNRYKNPQFILSKAPKLEKHTFISWITKDANSELTYKAEAVVEFEEDTILVAKWDCWPIIEAYDRYFTLDEAKEGVITEAKLLEKVIATDKEDGVLINGVNVLVKDYNGDNFINVNTDKQISVMYEAIDSFENCVTKVITVYIVDTEVKISPTVKYVRFISKEFYTNGQELIPMEQGGLENTSVWRTNKTYQNLLEKTLLNSKRNQSTKLITFLNMSEEIPDIVSGDWEQQKETWVFSYDDMKKIEEFTDAYGFGNLEIENATELFKNNFGQCIKASK